MRSQSQPATTVPQGKGKKEVPGPVLPPKIDRQKKPSKKSAAERLFGRGSEKEEKRDSKENSLTNGDPAGSDESPGGEKRSHGYDSMPPQESSKKNTYDSNSSGNFDSYNKHNEVPGYAYSRSISQPPAPAHYSGPRSVGAPPSSQGSGGAEKFRYSDYKPVPPPKPKPFSRSNSQPPSMTESNYMNGNYMNAGQTGAEQDYSHTNHYHSSRVAGIENGYASTNGNNYSPSNGYSGTNRVNGHAGQHNGQSNGTNGQSNGHHSMPNGHPMSNGYDDMDSNGVDSGQGSSLDRD